MCGEDSSEGKWLKANCNNNDNYLGCMVQAYLTAATCNADVGTQRSFWSREVGTVCEDHG